MKKQIGCGLVNYKKNCFFNSVIQALFHSPVFVDCLKKIVENHGNMDGTLYCNIDNNSSSFSQLIVLHVALGILMKK